MKKVLRSNISAADIENPLGELERINKSMDFLSAAIVEYPHEGGTQEVATILSCLSYQAQRNIKEIERVCGLA